MVAPFFHPDACEGDDGSVSLSAFQSDTDSPGGRLGSTCSTVSTDEAQQCYLQRENSLDMFVLMHLYHLIVQVHGRESWVETEFVRICREMGFGCEGALGHDHQQLGNLTSGLDRRFDLRLPHGYANVVIACFQLRHKQCNPPALELCPHEEYLYRWLREDAAVQGVTVFQFEVPDFVSGSGWLAGLHYIVEKAPPGVRPTYSGHAREDLPAGVMLAPICGDRLCNPGAPFTPLPDALARASWFGRFPQDDLFPLREANGVSAVMFLRRTPPTPVEYPQMLLSGIHLFRRSLTDFNAEAMDNGVIVLTGPVEKEGEIILKTEERIFNSEGSMDDDNDLDLGLDFSEPLF
jgi:hypothetical protein